MSIKDKVLGFFREEEGLTTVEYAIAGALVGLFVVGAFTSLGTAVKDTVCDIVKVLGGNCG